MGHQKTFLSYHHSPHCPASHNWTWSPICRCYFGIPQRMIYSPEGWGPTADTVWSTFNWQLLKKFFSTLRKCRSIHFFRKLLKIFTTKQPNNSHFKVTRSNTNCISISTSTWRIIEFIYVVLNNLFNSFLIIPFMNDPNSI